MAQGASPARDGHSSGTSVAGRLKQPTRANRPGDGPEAPGRLASLLFGLAPGGACHAAGVAAGAVRSYRTFSPLPAVGPRGPPSGGSLSVALSLGSPPPDVIRRRVYVEPGLSSACSEKRRPSGRLARREIGAGRAAVKPRLRRCERRAKAPTRRRPPGRRGCGRGSSPDRAHGRLSPSFRRGWRPAGPPPRRQR
jgi:hypothetical protein